MARDGCQAPGCGRPLPARRRRFCCDLCRIRGQRAERVTETGEFGRAAVRMIRQMARRVGASDLAEFGAMWEVMAEAELAVVAANDGLRASGYTWAEIAAEIGWQWSRLYQWRHRQARVSAVRDSGTPERRASGPPALTLPRGVSLDLAGDAD